MIDSSSHSKLSRRRIILSVIVVFAGVSIVAILWWTKRDPATRAQDLLRDARLQIANREYSAAETIAAAALELNPQLAEAAWVAAEAADLGRRPQSAAEYLERLQTDDESLKMRAGLMLAELYHFDLCRFRSAEAEYLQVLVISPDNIQANSGLAQLYALSGRNYEATPHVLKIIRAGRPTNLILLLLRDELIANDDDLLERARQIFPSDASFLLGEAGHLANDHQFDASISRIREAIEHDSELIYAHVMLGKILAASSNFEEIPSWNASLPAQAEEFPETWQVRGQYADHRNDQAGAIRCYLEAARRAPESKLAITRLSQLLAAAGETAWADAFGEKARQLTELEAAEDRAFFSSEAGSKELMLDFISKCETAGRVWEAYGFCLFAFHDVSSDPTISSRLTALARQVENLPLQQTIESENPALGVALWEYPVPNFDSTPTDVGHTEAVNGASMIAFRENTASTGFRFRYRNGTEDTPTRRVYEFTGGGVGVLDFDLDGCSDVYCTQGQAFPPHDTNAGALFDAVFRNRLGREFRDVTEFARLDESGFSQGVAVGDWNVDGFPDVYVANIGSNSLWLNNGDGTFDDPTLVDNRASLVWTSSCLMADISGDGFPDLYDVNYLTGPEIYDRICTSSDGSLRLCLPFEFDGEPDRLWLNNGDGTLTDVTGAVMNIVPDGKGLGIAAWNAFGDGHLALLVANDTTPNYFFRNLPTADGGFELREQGITSGIAFNQYGKTKGCMGIALGDVDGDGALDVHITNFLAESSTLYLNHSPGFFDDETRAWHLHEPTLEKLGFGTQFLDADLDGRQELFIANGHVDDLSSEGKPYRMRPQLFQQSGREFLELDAARLGTYFQSEHLGRAAAKLDWNRDGKMDLIVGQIFEDSVLLTNDTVDVGNHLALRLVGTQSNRDAIGTIVIVTVGGRTSTHQLTAGDGYQSSNERIVLVGVGSETSIDTLDVRWPSGESQVFTDVGVPSRWVLVEGQVLRSDPSISNAVESTTSDVSAP